VGDTEEGGGGDYSKIPQNYTTLVGEHVLARVQHVDELVGSDQQLLDGVGDLVGGVDKIGLQRWSKLVSGLGVLVEESGGEECVENMMMGENGFLAICGGGGEEEEEKEKEKENEKEKEEEEEEHDNKASTFSKNFMTGVGCGLVGLVLQQVCAIKKLTDSGRNHLIADLSYLCNVLTVLGLKKNLGLVQHVVGLLEENSKEGGRLKKVQRDLSIMERVVDTLDSVIIMSLFN